MGKEPKVPEQDGGMRGPVSVDANFAFQGRLKPDSFRDFARRRAARLSLDLEERGASSESFACRVSGPLALVDAFEMACSLGPLDCLVLDVWREDRTRELSNHV